MMPEQLSNNEKVLSGRTTTITLPNDEQGIVTRSLTRRVSNSCVEENAIISKSKSKKVSKRSKTHHDRALKGSYAIDVGHFGF